MIQDQPIWKTNLENNWGLFTHTEYRLPASAHEDTSKKSKKEKNKPKQKATADTPFYFSKLKQEIKGTTICTPKGYGIIQSIDQDKNTISVKVQGQVYEFDKSEAITEIPLSVIYLKDSTKVEETVYLPVNSTLKEMFEKVESSVGTQEKDKIIDVKIFFQGKEITKSDETLEKLKIVPYSKFLTTYTPGKAYSVKRFTHTNQGWCVASNNNLDAIAFQASKNIRVIGFSVYPVMTGDDHPASIVLHAGDSTKHEQLCRTEVTVSKEAGAPDTQPVKVLFNKPYLLKSGEFFSVGISFVTSGNSYYGNGGQIKMEGEGDVTFTFKNCVGANNGTGTSSGQIPEILYYA